MRDNGYQAVNVLADYKSMNWRWVPGYKGYYQVSRFGEVRSVPRVVWYQCLRPDGLGFTWRWAKLTLKGRIMTQTADLSGHFTVKLSKNGISKDYSVHRLVLDAFVGPRPKEMECRHLDGNPMNNRLDNLRWGTSGQNRVDMYSHGRGRGQQTVVPIAKRIKKRIQRAYRSSGLNRGELIGLFSTLLGCDVWQVAKVLKSVKRRLETKSGKI